MLSFYVLAVSISTMKVSMVQVTHYCCQLRVVACVNIRIIITQEGQGRILYLMGCVKRLFC